MRGLFLHNLILYWWLAVVTKLLAAVIEFDVKHKKCIPCVVNLENKIYRIGGIYEIFERQPTSLRTR